MTRHTAAFLGLVVSGCATAEPVFEGKPASEWVRALEAEDPTVRRSAAHALGEIGPAAGSAVPALTRALKDNNTLVRAAAAEALGRMGPDARSAMPTLLTVQARDDEDVVRREASVALALIQSEQRKGSRLPFYLSLGAVLLVLIICGLGGWRIFARLRAQSIVQLLKHQDAQVRRRAAVTLGVFGSAARAAVPALIEALKDKDPAVARAAEHALLRMGLRGKADLSVLMLALRDENPLERMQAAVQIGLMGPEAEAAVPALIVALNDPKPHVQLEVIVALGNLRSTAKPAVPALMSLHCEKDYAIRRARDKSLQKIGSG